VSILANVDLQRPLTDHPLWRGLRGLWLPVAETAKGGTLYDLSPYRNHGTLTYMDPATGWVATDRGMALDFDGVNDFVDCGNDSSLANLVEGEFTLSVLAYKSNTDDDLISNGISASGTYLLQVATGGYAKGHVWRSGSTATVVTGTIALASGWHMLHQVVDAAALRIYVDGVYDNGSGLNGTPVGSSNIIRIGSRGSSNYWLGLIALAAIHARALTASELATLYNQSLQGYPDLIRRTPTRRMFYFAPSAAVNLSVNSASHAHRSDAVTLATTVALVVADAGHTQTSDNITLGSTASLVVDSQAYAHRADNVTLDVVATIETADASHAETEGNVALSTTVTLAIDSAVHGQQSDNALLSGDDSLVTADVSHAQASDNATLTTTSALIVDSQSHAQASDNEALDSAATLTIGDASHGHTSSSPLLATIVALAVDAARHAQWSATVTLAPPASVGAVTISDRSRYNLSISDRSRYTLTLSETGDADG